MKKYLKLLRVKHYIKNGLIFLPLFFSLQLFEWSSLLRVGLGLIAFCFISSVVYILNDLKDIEKDRLHSTKKNRPLASGAIKVPVAVIIAVLLIGLAAGILIYLKSILGAVFIGIYLFINIAYSLGLKNVPILETAILATGFLLRVLFGGAIISVTVSPWLIYTIISAALCMGLGKRRNEILKETGETRKVSKVYSKDFLDKTMYIFFTLTIAFYALWCIFGENVVAFENPGIIWSVPIVMIIIMRYCFLIEQNAEGGSVKSDGDPTNVLLTDKMLLAFVAIYLIFILCVVYVPFGTILGAIF